MGSLCPKNMMLQLEISEELCVFALRGDAKFKGKLTRGLKNNIRNLINFYGSSQKCEDLHFEGLFLFRVYKDLDENVQKSYVS